MTRSRQEHSETTLHEQNRELQTGMAARDAQLAAAARELRNLALALSHRLRAVDHDSATLLAHHGERLDADAWLLLERLRSGVHKLHDLVDDLHELARLSRNPPGKWPVDGTALALGVAHALQKTGAPDRMRNKPRSASSHEDPAFPQGGSMPEQKPGPGRRETHVEDLIDESGEESFPASDPPAVSPKPERPPAADKPAPGHTGDTGSSAPKPSK